MSARCIFFAVLLIAVADLGPVRAENWPQWRGPFLNGSTTETNLPRQLHKQNDLVWVTPLPGRSGATPVAWGDSIFLPSPDPQKNLLLFCLDRASGKVRWQKQVGFGDRVVGKNNMASCSAITDGQRVYALFGTTDFAAYDFAGNEVWRKPLKAEFGAFASMFLYGASPVLYQGKLYLPILQRNPPTYGHAQDGKPERKSWLLCIDPATGKVIWSHERTTGAREEAMEAYTTPMPLEGPGGNALVVVGADCVTAHAADTGAELWRYAGMNRARSTGARVVPSPVVGGGMVFAIGPKREMLVAIPGGGTGAIAEDKLAWKVQQYIPDVSTPLYYQGKLFVLDGDRQVLNCYEPKTGRLLGQGRLGVREIFYSSPTGADGKIYCLSEDGTLVVLTAAEKPEVLSSTSFGEGPCMSSVVVSGAQFFIRTSKNIYCLQKRN